MRADTLNGGESPASLDDTRLLGPPLSLGTIIVNLPEILSSLVSALDIAESEIDAALESLNVSLD